MARDFHRHARTLAASCARRSVGRWRRETRLRLGAGLCLATPDTRWWQQVVGNGEPTGVAVRLDERDERVRLGLAFLDGRKVVDVSVDPSSWVTCLRRGAEAMYEPDTRWADALNTGLQRTGAERGWWNELPERLEPEVTAAAAAWPLVRPAIRAGFDERVVPRWAIPLLASTDVATGTRAVLGGRANRRVIREMANAMSGPVRWWPIACAIAIGQLDGGRVGDLLSESHSTYRCTQDERLLLGTTLRRTRPDVVRRLLATAEVDGGPQRLLAALDGWNRIPTHNRQLPNTLDRLEAVVLAELDVCPPQPVRPVPEIALAEPAPPLAAAPIPRPVPRPAAARVERREPVPAGRIEYCEPWRRLHRARRGSVELVLPATADEVHRWGQALDNCLGIYARAAEDGRTLIVGIKRDERLVGAVQISTFDRTIIQIEGRSNRPLPEWLHDEVLTLIAGVRIRERRQR